MLNWLNDWDDLRTREDTAELQSKIHENMLDQLGTPEAATQFIVPGRAGRAKKL